MADSESPVVTDDLDAFEAEFFGKTPDKSPVETNEVEEEVENSEIETPSATEGNESEDEADDESEESIEDEDTLAEEDAHAEDEEDDGSQKSKRRKPAKERIQELTAARREAERRADALERQIAELRQNKDKSEDTKREAAPAAPLEAAAPNPDERLESGEPKYPMGEFDPHYIRDLTRFTIQQERADIENRAAQERQAREIELAQQALTESWTEKLTSAREELPDLVEKAVDLEHEFRNLEPKYGEYLAATIMSLDYGPHVLDYLADHLDEARKIVAAGPTQATIALGRIEARIAATKERKSNEVEKGKVSNAAPPPPRTRGSGGRTSVKPDTDDLDAFEKLYFA